MFNNCATAIRLLTERVAQPFWPCIRQAIVKSHLQGKRILFFY